MTATRTLDCVGLFCPMPVYATKKEIDTLKPGDILEIVADDPGFEKDLPAWCEKTGNIFLKMEKKGPRLHGFVQKK